MSKSKLHLTTRTLGTGLMVLGALIMAFSSQTSLNANLTEQGSVAGAMTIGDPMWTQGHAVLPAAPIAANGMGTMALGMLLVLMGLGMHAYWTLRVRSGDRMVPVKQAKKKADRKSRRQMEVIWVERTIRF